MNHLITFLIESGLTAALFTLFFMLALVHEKSFVFNRFYLLGATLFSLVIPFVHFTVNAAPFGLATGTVVLESVEFYNSNASSGWLLPEDLWLWVYIGIAAFGVIRVGWKSLSIWYMARKHAAQRQGEVILLEGSTEAFTFMHTIFMGDRLTGADREVILAHERVHAKEKHSLDILVLELACAICWINPVFYMIKKLARTNHEYLADARVVDEAQKDNYLQILSMQVLKYHGFELAHQFHTSATLKRIKMLNQKNSKIMKIKQILPFAMALALLIIFGCDDAIEQLSQQDDVTAAKTITEYAANGEIYDEVDNYPMPEGDMTHFYSWIGENLKYPVQARKAGVEGRVFVEFIVDPEGKLTKVKAIKGIGAGCDKAAVDLIKVAPKWTPGSHKGKPVSVRMILPISFALN